MVTKVTDYLRVRETATDEPEPGLTLWLLPSGASAPGGLIELTANAYLTHQYDFPIGVTNGLYTVYYGAAGSQVPVELGGVEWQVEVYRDGIVTAENTDFVY